MTSIPYRRKREGRTNYKKRLALLKSRKPRLVVRRSNTQLTAQIVFYDPKGDKVTCGIRSGQLKKLGWKFSCASLPAAYLAGKLLANTLKDKKLKLNDVLLDIGLHTPVKGGRIYALVKGAVDGGVNVVCSDEIFPKEDRLRGKHIQDYMSNEKYKEFAKLFDALNAKL